MNPLTRKNPEGPIEMGGVVLQPHARIGSYIFLREIGSGGMARVLLARNPAGELVALKVLRENRFKTGMARFRREFHALSRINHPNVVRVESYGDLFGHPYFAMEYVDGPDLHALIRSFRTWDPEKRWKRVEEVLIDLARALSAIHRWGFVHRDLKPSNVLIDRNSTCKLSDFGIVKDMDPSRDPYKSTTLVGTWAYASPEQISGEAIDHRSDLYSLGVILFAALTGKRPFVAKDMAGYLELHRDRPAPAPRAVNRDIPAHLDEICRRLLQKAPRDRYQSAQEILYRLEAHEQPARAPSPAAEWEPELLGRTLEMEVISNQIAALTRKEPGLIVVEGDDGSGRSRLLERTADRVREMGFPLHQLAFDNSSPVYTSLLAFAKQLALDLGESCPQDLHAAIELFSKGDAPAGSSRNILQDGLREALKAALEHSPQVILADDLHLAHPRELDLLSYLLRTLMGREKLPLLVAFTLRPRANDTADRIWSDERLGVEAVQIAVGALSKEDLQQMVYELVGEDLASRVFAARLHRETEGNPYFVTEFLRTLMAKGVIARSGAAWKLTLGADEIATGHLDIPPGIRQMMRSRLSVLKAKDRKVLDVLAVSGREVDLDVLLDVLLDWEEDDLVAAMDHLLGAGIIRERRVGQTVYYAVTHRKFADVVYRDMNPESRATLHKAIAEVLELRYTNSPAALEVVGEHYRRAGDSARAYRYLVAASKRLADRSLMQEAWELTEKAATMEEYARDSMSREEFDGFRRDIFAVRASVHYNRAEWPEAETGWRAVMALDEERGDHRRAIDSRLELAVVLRRRGKHAESRACGEAALEASRQFQYREGITESLHAMSALAWAEGKLEDCERLAEEGLDVAKGPEMAERRAELLLALTAAQATRGNLSAATTGLNEAEAIFRDLRRKRPRCLALANIAELLTWQGEPLKARQRAHLAVKLAAELDYKLGLTGARRAMSVAALDLGLYEEAHDGLEEAYLLARDIKLPEEMIASLTALAQLALELNNPKEAQARATEALAMTAKRDPERYEPLLKALLAAALASPSPTDAQKLAYEADDELGNLPVPRRTQVQLALARAWRALHRPDLALTRARHVSQVAGSRGFALLSLEARALLAALQEGEEALMQKTAGAELAREFLRTLSPEMAKHFAQRPFLAEFGEILPSA